HFLRNHSASWIAASISLSGPVAWFTNIPLPSSSNSPTFRRMLRCPWATIEPAITYHDKEWGVPVRNDRRLFEFLILEGAQAGLSWITILRKRANYRRALDQFRPEKIATFGTRDIARLMADPGLVRNRLKILATIQNAKSFLTVQEEFGAFH